MGVPATVTDLSTTANSNSPSGSDSVGSSTGPDDYIRALAAIVRREQAQFTAVASASSVNLGAIATGNYGHITGVTTINSFGTVAAGIERTVVFDGILTLTHSANLILPAGVNKTTAAGDVATFISEGSGIWRCVSYLPYTATVAYLAVSNNLSDLASASTARTNLGLGTVATLATGTSSGQVPTVGSTTSATTTLTGLSRHSTTAENAAGTGVGVVRAADLPTAINALSNVVAWVTFDSSSGSSCVIPSGGAKNVSSVTYNGTGNYTINFSTALADTVYMMVGSAIRSGFTQVGVVGPRSGGTYTVNACQINVNDDGGTSINSPKVSVLFIR